MPYFTITDFAAGLDLRRSPLTAPAGTLRSLTNAHITPGGEIEKRFGFELVTTLDPASRSLAELNQKIYSFYPGGTGEIITEPASEFEVGQIKLATTNLRGIYDHDKFDRKIYTIADADRPDPDNPTGPPLPTAHFFSIFADPGDPTGTPPVPATVAQDGVLVPNQPRGSYCRTYKSKMYATGGTSLYYSEPGNPMRWTETIDPGGGKPPYEAPMLIDLSLQDSDMTSTQALEAYYDKLAIFSDTAVQLWTIDPDPTLSQFQQTLRQAGTIAPMSALQYGSGDVLYLAPDGIRSLRARNSSLAASVSDVGSPLDPVLQNLYRTRGMNFLQPTISLLQPVAGRFWVIVQDRIYILSAYPGPKVTAWSEYDPGFTITAAAVANQRVWVRDDANNVYLYGGTNPAVPLYDTAHVEVVLPFHGGEKPETYKRYLGLDAVCTGTWDVYASFDPTTNAEDYLGQITGPTTLQGRIKMEGYSTHISLRLRSPPNSTGAKNLSNLTIHYEPADAS